MYSAKKVQGRKLYEMARRGEEVERKAVPVTIHELATACDDGGELLRQNEDGTLDLRVRVVCSAGTYIRVLAEEIGERLGAGAHLASLRRTRAGQFGIAAATRLDDAQEMRADDILLPPDAALSFMPFAHLTADEAQQAGHGIAVRLAAENAAAFNDQAFVRLLDDRGSLIAVGIYDAGARSLQPRVVLV